MRLIDADEFCRYTDEHCQDGFADLWKELIRRQPTAFDKEKVIEKIKEIMNDESIRFVDQAVNRTIEIVEKGGIE